MRSSELVIVPPTTEAFCRLIKESEIETNRPGRMFQVRGAERLDYRVQIRHAGYRVQRLDDHGEPTCTIDMLEFMLADHCIGRALREGHLMTEQIDA